MADLTVYRGGGEWSALYVDGRLDKVGDHYLIDERVYEIAGVTVVVDDAFMRGQKYETHVAQTIADVDAYIEARDANVRLADEKRIAAQTLLAEARRLDPEGRGIAG
jgi:hypothetical protein